MVGFDVIIVVIIIPLCFVIGPLAYYLQGEKKRKEVKGK